MNTHVKSDVKSAFAKLDDNLAAILMEALQLALNDEDTINRVKDELPKLTETQLQILSSIAIDISTSEGGDIAIKNMADFNSATQELDRLKNQVY